MTEPLWTIEDVRRFLAVESMTTAYKVAARPDAPRSVRITPGARRWVPEQWREWAQVRRIGVCRSKTFARKLDAQEWAAQLERELENGNGQLRERRTLREVCEDYAREVSPTKRGERWEVIRLRAICREPMADRDISQIGTTVLAAWRDERLRVVSAGALLRDITLLSAVFEYARRERRLIDANPVRDMRKPSSPKPRTRLPTDEDIAKKLS